MLCTLFCYSVHMIHCDYVYIMIEGGVLSEMSADSCEFNRRYVHFCLRCLPITPLYYYEGYSNVSAF